MSVFTEEFWEENKTVQLTLEIKDPKAFSTVVDHIFGDKKNELILGAEITAVKWGDSQDEIIGKAFQEFLMSLAQKNVYFNTRPGF